MKKEINQKYYIEKLRKLKNVKVEKQKTTKFTFFVKPYVKNDIFETKYYFSK